MKQKALPAGTAQALGGGGGKKKEKRKKKRFGFTEKHVLMDNRPHSLVFLWNQ